MTKYNYFHQKEDQGHLEDHQGHPEDHQGLQEGRQEDHLEGRQESIIEDHRKKVKVMYHQIGDCDNKIKLILYIYIFIYLYLILILIFLYSTNHKYLLNITNFYVNKNNEIHYFQIGKFVLDY